jgi:hypothetical protein
VGVDRRSAIIDRNKWEPRTASHDRGVAYFSSSQTRAGLPLQGRGPAVRARQRPLENACRWLGFSSLRALKSLISVRIWSAPELPCALMGFALRVPFQAPKFRSRAVPDMSDIARDQLICAGRLMSGRLSRSTDELVRCVMRRVRYVLRKSRSMARPRKWALLP